MKKILSVMLITVMILSCFSVVAFAEESYDNVWTMHTDKSSYEPGDYLILTIKNGVEIPQFNGALIHFTFDENVLEYVTDYNELYDALEIEPQTLPGVTSYGTSTGGEIATDGEFVDTISSAGNIIRANRVVYTVYFKVKQDIVGTNQVNFRWVLNSKNYPSWVVSVTQGDGEDIKTYFNVNFVSASANVIGENLAQEPQYLSAESTYVFSGKNETGDNIIEINGVKKSITSRYAVAYSKVAPRNDGVVKLAAGFILSKENSNLTLESKNIKIFEARNFGSDNMFTGLFYGPGLKAGETYYVIPYVTYTNGETLYASEAQSFTMPE